MIISLPIAVEVLAQGSVSDRKFASFAAVALERSLGLNRCLQRELRERVLEMQALRHLQIECKYPQGGSTKTVLRYQPSPGGCGFQLKNL